ncbi:MAG: uroporphyrinogen-III synthase [Pseudomonadota bacterium]
MHLIVTRPAEDAECLITRLAARGHNALGAPMVSIAFLENVSIPRGDWQAVLVTSANGIRALQKNDGFQNLLDVPVLTVGPASSAAAQNAGFRRVESANGDLSALTALARETLSPANGPLLYPSGIRISGDLQCQMEQSGFACTRVPLYAAIAAQTLPMAAANLIRSGAASGVLLYSPRTAKTWANCVEAGKLSPGLQDTVHWCLSAAVGAALSNAWPGRAVPPLAIPPEPNETSMIEAICAASDA